MFQKAVFIFYFMKMLKIPTKAWNYHARPDNFEI